MKNKLVCVVAVVLIVSLSAALFWALSENRRLQEENSALEQQVVNWEMTMELQEALRPSSQVILMGEPVQEEGIPRRESVPGDWIRREFNGSEFYIIPASSLETATRIPQNEKLKKTVGTVP